MKRNECMHKRMNDKIETVFAPGSEVVPVSAMILQQKGYGIHQKHDSTPWYVSRFFWVAAHPLSTKDPSPAHLFIPIKDTLLDKVRGEVLDFQDI